MKHALVTGADGFIGSHLTESLLAKGYRVRALALYNSFNDWGWLEGVAPRPNLEIVSGDIRDPFLCRHICADVDVVFNLAALIAIPYSYKAPQSYVETNVTGTLNMCQAAMDAKVKRFVHMSTSETYGTAQYVPIDEKHPLQPQSPYSASKIGGDAMAMSYHSSFGLPLTIARAFNTYGPRQSARAVIPTIISQIAAGKSEIDLGDTRPTRDFNFVLDTCAGIMAVAEHEATIGKTVNVGSGWEVSIEETFEMIRTLMKSSCKLRRDEKRLRPENSEVFRLLCDNRLLKSLTGFEVAYPLEKGLALTIDWFLKPANLSRYKTDIYNV